MPSSAPSITIAASASRGRVDAIRDHTYLLAEAVETKGVSVEFRLRADDGTWCSGGALTAGLEASDAFLLQYNPFMYGRWGFAPWLPLALARMRLRRARPRIGLLVHETYMPLKGWRWTLMGLWQRAQLVALLPCADVVLTSTEKYARDLGRLRRRGRTVHVPVGSNLPDARRRRAEQRARLGVGDDTVVLAAFGTGHPGRLFDHVVGAANAVAASSHVVVLNLGAGAPPADGIDPRIRVHTPGELDAMSLAVELAAADVFLAPFTDGVSTKRSTVMAALQHGVPVVGTDGTLTDEVLRTASPAVRLVPVGRVDHFAGAVAELARDREARAVAAAAARELYERRFDWPLTAAAVVTGLRLSAPAGRRERA